MVSVPSNKTVFPAAVITYKLEINRISSDEEFFDKLKTGLNDKKVAINSKAKFFIRTFFGFWISH